MCWKLFSQYHIRDHSILESPKPWPKDPGYCREQTVVAGGVTPERTLESLLSPGIELLPLVVGK